MGLGVAQYQLHGSPIAEKACDLVENKWDMLFDYPLSPENRFAVTGSSMCCG